MEEFRADPAVEANAFGDVMHIRPDLFTKIGDLIDEGDLGGQKGVGGVFDQFRRFAIGEQDRRFNQRERPVHPLHQGPRAFRHRADHDAVWAHEIFDGGAFAQEFGVGDDVEPVAVLRAFFQIGAGLAQDRSDLAARAHRNRRFGDDAGVAGQRTADLFRRRIDV